MPIWDEYAMKAINSDVQVTQIRPASRRGSRGGIPSCGIWTARRPTMMLPRCKRNNVMLRIPPRSTSPLF